MGFIRTRRRGSEICEVVSIASTPPLLEKERGKEKKEGLTPLLDAPLS
jgi:hypothetical protein